MIVPVQWKQAVITPLPKINKPLSCSDFRPISLTPILSRLLEKLVVRNFIYPAFNDPTIHSLLTDQFAFRPTGSTEAALISILHHISNLLTTNPYVRIIALDFSKAFDTVRHFSTLQKLSTLPIPDNIYNWFVNHFQNHSHITKFLGESSKPASINCSVFQGSVVGPPLFIVNGIDLNPVYSGNLFDKYADDTYLLIPACNEHTIYDELQSIEQWAVTNNLKLNKSKSMEMIVFASAKARAKTPHIPTISDIVRVNCIKALGVLVDDTLTFKAHISSICSTAAQSLYAIKILKAHGMDPHSILSICSATVVSRLTYAITAWWGFISAADRYKLQAVLNRAKKWTFYSNTNPSIAEICAKQDSKLFKKVLSNQNHVLHHLLPAEKQQVYCLRPRAHNRELPLKTSSLIAKNFLIRVLYDSIV